MKHVVHLAVLLASLAGALPAWASSSQAQSAPVTVADIEALQLRIDDLRASLRDLPPGDAGAQDRLRLELDDLDDEAVYLKVKARKQGVAPAEFSDLHSRVDALEESIRQRRAMNAEPAERSVPPPPGSSAPPPPPMPITAGATPPSPPTPIPTPPAPPVATATATPPAPPVPDEEVPPVPPAPPYPSAPIVDGETAPTSTPRVASEIPVGQQLDVRVQAPLSSETAQVEDRFEATTLVDLYEGSRLLVPAGSLMRGVVSSVEKAGRLDRKGSLTLTFDQLTVRGVAYPVRATVTQTIESPGVKKEFSKIGVGAGMGAMIGGMIAGPQGAAAGVFIGAGGALFAVPGKDVNLPSGAILRVRFDTPVVVR